MVQGTQRFRQVRAASCVIPYVLCGCLYCLSVRPGAAGLLIGIECSRVRDSPWMYLTSFVTTRISIELAVVQRKLPDYVVVGFQPYSARTFHVTLSPPDI